MPKLRMTTAADAADSVDLARVAEVGTPWVERALARVDPASGWLARKLSRESVRADLSAVLVDDRGRWIGFMWAGVPPGMPATACAAGLAVLPEHRGNGHAGRLIQACLDLAHDDGRINFRCLSQPPLEAMYLHRGFHVVRRCITLTATGRNEAATSLAELRDASSPSTPAPAHYEFGWRPEIWARTPPGQRFSFELGGGQGRAYASRETGGVLVHGLTATDPHPLVLLAMLDDIPRHIPASMRLFVYGVPESMVRRHDLLDTAHDPSWRAAQPFAVMERFTAPRE